jgi:hypothetical protein
VDLVLESEEGFAHHDVSENKSLKINKFGENHNCICTWNIDQKA